MDVTPVQQNIYNVSLPSQVAAIGASSAAIANPVGAWGVLLASTGNCHVVIADTPTATSTSFYLPANVVIAVACQPTNKVAVIQDGSSTGNLFVTSLNCG